MCVIETLADQIFIDESGQKTVRQRYRTKRGKERYRYVTLISCQRCGDDFVPTRRGVHKYCSNSCRSIACKKRNKYEYRQYLPAQTLENVNLISVPNEDKWNWMRTGENAAASGAVATVQYFALKEIITKQTEQIRRDIRLSEQRNAKNTLTIVDSRLKQLKQLKTPPKAPGIDAHDML